MARYREAGVAEVITEVEQSYSFTVPASQAAEVRAMLRADGVAFTERRFLFIWRVFEVTQTPSVWRQIQFDLHDLLHEEPL